MLSNQLWHQRPCEIDISDPGAVPGASTRIFHGGETGLTGYGKGICAVSGEIPPLSVQNKMNANDNELAPVALAA